MKIGLALGGGAARGLAHIGVIKAFEKAGIEIGYIAGTSIGSIVGGMYAAGVRVPALEAFALELKGRTYWRLFAPALKHSGFIDGDNMTNYFKSVIIDRDILKLEIPFKAIATDFITGERVVFEKGSLFNALRASSAIPILFTPAVIDNTIYIDGGFSDPVPTGVVRDMGAEMIVSVNVVPRLHYKTPLPGKSKAQISFMKGLGKWRTLPFETLGKMFFKIDYNKEHKVMPNLLNISMQTGDIIEANLIRSDLEINKPDYLLEPNYDKHVGWFDFPNAAEIIANGERAAEKIVDELKSKCC
jgi:NTE family protein